MSSVFGGGFSEVLLALPVGAALALAVGVWGLTRGWRGGGFGAVLGALIGLAWLPASLSMASRLSVGAPAVDAVRRAVVTDGAAQLGVWFGPLQVLGLFGLAAAVLAVNAGGVSARRGAPIAVGALAAAVVVAVGGQLHEDVLFAAVRAAVIVAIGVPLAVGCGSSSPRGDGLAIAAAPALPLVVAFGECAQRGLMQLLVVAQVEVVSAADWPRAVVWFVEVSAPTARFGTGALAIATLAAAATLVGRRGPGRAAAAGVVASSWLAWGLAQGPTDRLLALGPLCPEVVPAAAPPADSPSEDVTNQ